MKNITALIALICMIGLAGAQIGTLGDGYSSTQRAFFNEPTTSTFEPIVQTYWSNYIVGNQNQTNQSMKTEMDMWVNHFPLQFSNPLQIGSTSFKSNTPILALSEKDKNSLALKTEVYRELGLYDTSKFSVDKGSLNNSSVSAPAADATGNLISQSVMSFFNI